MTDREYQTVKKAICSEQSACNELCPLYRYANKQGMHACGCLCDILEQRNSEVTKTIAEEWLKNHPGFSLDAGKES